MGRSMGMRMSMHERSSVHLICNVPLYALGPQHGVCLARAGLSVPAWVQCDTKSLHAPLVPRATQDSP